MTKGRLFLGRRVAGFDLNAVRLSGKLWTTLLVGVMLLRYWCRRRQEKLSTDIARIFE
jgi:hypothetical protein